MSSGDWELGVAAVTGGGGRGGRQASNFELMFSGGWELGVAAVTGMVGGGQASSQFSINAF